MPIEAVPKGQVTFLVHGPDADEDGLVPAGVFAAKLAALVRALKAADRAQNGEARHDYKIKKLHTSTPTATLIETSLPPFRKPQTDLIPEFARSGIDGFRDCADAIVVGERDRALSYGKCATYLNVLSSGASKSFGYAEVWAGQSDPLRVDPFLKERTVAVIAPKKVRESAKDHWFKGVASGSFDGTILEVDLRGSLPECKLVLSAGGQELDCVCRAEDLEQIRTALNHRVQIYGRAIYDGKSGLPRRVEVASMEMLSGAGNLSAWRGAFEPFEPSPWEGDD